MIFVVPASTDETVKLFITAVSSNSGTQVIIRKGPSLETILRTIINDKTLLISNENATIFTPGYQSVSFRQIKEHMSVRTQSSVYKVD